MILLRKESCESGFDGFLCAGAAFVAAISPTSSFSRECRTEGAIRVPLDLPGEVLCFPAQLFSRSKIDLVVPPVFAAAVVAGSAWVVRAFSLWQFDQAH